MTNNYLKKGLSMSKIQSNSPTFGAYMKFKAKSSDARKLKEMTKQSTEHYVIYSDNKQLKNGKEVLTILTGEHAKLFNDLSNAFFESTLIKKLNYFMGEAPKRLDPKRVIKGASKNKFDFTQGSFN